MAIHPPIKYSIGTWVGKPWVLQAGVKYIFKLDTTPRMNIHNQPFPMHT